MIIVSTFTSLICQSSEGRDFWFSFLEHKNKNNNSKVCFVSSKYDTEGIISLPGKFWSKEFTIKANKITKIALPKDAETIGNESIDNNGVHLVSKKPCSVYIHQYHQYRSEACLVLPITSIGNHYYTMSYFGGNFSGTDYPSEFLIVGTEDSTIVDIILSDATLSGKPKGSTITIRIEQGETYQIQGKKGMNDLTGSYISSTKPIAVFSGNMYTKVPTNCSHRDNLLEQMAPIESWGKKYISIPFKNQNASIIRIIAAENNTNITVTNPSNTTQYNLNSGEFVEFQLSSPSYVEASEPIAVAQFMKGALCNGHGLGDPAMIMLNSLEQMRDTVSLFSSNLEQIREKYVSMITFTDNIDNVTYNGKKITELSVPVQLIIANKDYSFINVKVQKDLHQILSSGCGVIAYGYGYGDAESYAYSAGASYSNINNVPIPEGACLNDTVTFDSKLSKDRYSFHWDLGDGTQSTEGKFDHIYNSLETYHIKLTVTDLCLGSIATFEQDLIVSLREPVIAGDDFNLCQGDEVTLSVSDTPHSTYIWNGPDNYFSTDQNPIIKQLTLEQSGVYTVIGIESGCASYPDTLNVIIHPNPSPDLGEDLFICPSKEYTSIELSPGVFNSYKWSDGSELSSLTIDKGGHYFVSVHNQYNCNHEDSISIIEICPTKIYVPNIFRPSGNDNNSLFGINGNDILSMELAIFDRWGNKVFNSNNIDEKWDGYFKGKLLQSGVFTWVLNYKGHNERGEIFEDTKVGDISLVR